MCKRHLFLILRRIGRGVRCGVGSMLEPRTLYKQMIGRHSGADRRLIERRTRKGRSAESVSLDGRQGIAHHLSSYVRG